MLGEPTDLPEGAEVELLPLDPSDWLDDSERAAYRQALRASDVDVAEGRLVDAEETLRELRGDRAWALTSLEHAIGYGFHPYELIAKHNPFIEPLRADPRLRRSRRMRDADGPPSCREGLPDQDLSPSTGAAVLTSRLQNDAFLRDR